MKQRKALHNIATFEEFEQFENAEKSSDPNKQQLHLVINQADKIIVNAGTVKELNDAIDEIISAVHCSRQENA